MKTRAGDVIAVEVTDATYYNGRPTETRTRVHVATVTRATREGIAVEWSDVRGYRMGAKGKVVVIQSDKIAKEDVLRVAREHHWPEHPNQPMPFDSLAELREALRPYLIANQSA